MMSNLGSGMVQAKREQKGRKLSALWMSTAVLSLCVYTGASWAADVVVDQKDVQFWFDGKTLKPGDEIKAKVGDTLRIMNSDKVTHNAFSLSEKLFFDAGAQKPKSEKGEDYLVKLEAPGVFDIGCAIHPNMTFKLKVE